MGIILIIFAAIVVIGGISAVLGIGDSDEADPTPTPLAETQRSEPEDITDWVKGARPDKADLVTSATRDDTGFIEVQTSITDPRGDDLSPEAADALAICVGIADQGETRGRILEADGTTFVTLRDGVCAEQ